MDFLTEEEQYKEVLNTKEIERIKDSKLRDIRMNFWNKKHEAFMNEVNIPDCELENVYNRIRKQELKEIEEYRKNIKV